MQRDTSGLGDHLVAVQQALADWRSRSSGELFSPESNFFAAKALKPFLRQYGIDPTPVLEHARGHPSESNYEKAESAVDELDFRSVSRFFQQWEPDIRAVVPADVSPTNKMARAVVESFRSFELRFRKALNHVPADHYEDDERWVRKVEELAQTAAYALRDAVKELPPPFWRFGSFEIDCDCSNGLAASTCKVELRPPSYWLYFMGTLLGIDGVAKVLRFPSDEVRECFADVARTYAIENEVNELLWDGSGDSPHLRCHLFCATSVVACRVFANWCAGTGDDLVGQPTTSTECPDVRRQSDRTVEKPQEASGRGDAGNKSTVNQPVDEVVSGDHPNLKEVCGFRLDGDAWVIDYMGAHANIKNRQGFPLIHSLIGRRCSGDRSAVHYMEVEALFGKGCVESISEDTVTDQEAIDHYESEIHRLQREIDDSVSEEETAALKDQQQELARRLYEARGIRGRPRQNRPVCEKTRKRVMGNIIRAIGEIEKTIPALGEHLRKHLRSIDGEWAYRIEAPPAWNTSPYEPH